MKKETQAYPKVTTDDIRAIKSGTSVTYTVGRPKELASIKVRAYMLNSQEPELGKKYSCSLNYLKRQITITANPL